MIILLHVIIALTSIVSTTLLAFIPSRLKMGVSFGLIGATLASGTYLVISTHSSLVSSCLTGLAYLSVALAGVGVGAYRMARQETRN